MVWSTLLKNLQYTSFTVLHRKAKAESEDENETSYFTIACSHAINMELSNNLGND